MSGWYFDTPVLVAGFVSQHPHNSRAFAALQEAFSSKVKVTVGGHGLAECYSVLTRTPFRPAIYPGEAWRMLEALMARGVEVVTLTGSEYGEVVKRCAERGWTGGRVHDAVQAHCAVKSGCDRVYTFNVRDFEAIVPGGGSLRVCAP